MIICICRAKTDRDVTEAIEAGAASIADLKKCGIGTDCGGCHNVLRVMLAEAAMPVADAVLAARCSVLGNSSELHDGR